MNIDQLLNVIRTDPESINIDDVIATIDAHYNYQPTRFANGAVMNEAGDHETACKIFAFARLHDLDHDQTLACFGNLYRDEVRNHVHDAGYPNIRTFMVCGWRGIEFQSDALTEK